MENALILYQEPITLVSNYHNFFFFLRKFIEISTENLNVVIGA